MLATRSDAVREYAFNVGHDRPLQQWILSDYDTWERNPFYIGPDMGHPDDEVPRGFVYETFLEASENAKFFAKDQGSPIRLEHYKGRCWAIWF